MTPQIKVKVKGEDVILTEQEAKKLKRDLDSYFSQAVVSPGQPVCIDLDIEEV